MRTVEYILPTCCKCGTAHREGELRPLDIPQLWRKPCLPLIRRFSTLNIALAAKVFTISTLGAVDDRHSASDPIRCTCIASTRGCLHRQEPTVSTPPWPLIVKATSSFLGAEPMGPPFCRNCQKCHYLTVHDRQTYWWSCYQSGFSRLMIHARASAVGLLIRLQNSSPH
jgi:hypothetical protein